MAKKRKRGRPRYREEEFHSLNPDAKRGIVIVLIFVLALLSVLSFLNLAGMIGEYIDIGLGIAFGWGRFLFPIILIGVGYVLARPSIYNVSIPNYIGLGLLLLSVHGLLHLKLPVERAFDLALNGVGGGMLGFGANYFLIQFTGVIATLLILIAILVSSLILTFNTSIENLVSKTNVFQYITPFFRKNDENEDEDDDEDDDEEETEDEEIEEEEDADDGRTQKVKHAGQAILAKEAQPRRMKVPKFKVDLPLTLLDDRSSKPMSGDINAGMEKISHTLENFNINVEMKEVKVGPTVTQYTLKPSEGVKLSRITSLNNDLALALAAHPIRIEAPIPGKSLVGIEVPNQKPAVVRIRETFEAKSFKKRKISTLLALGKDVSGKCWSDDLTKMPHLLVAGATGSGKSVCLNAIILSLLYQNNPDTLRLIMVDPKRVEFPIYNGIPHLLTPVITDVTKTVYALRWAITEMDRRFDILAKAKKRDVGSYNLTAKEKIPFLVIIIDELADLMIAAAAEVEACVIRLTQMARAVGIHLIVATQRPSVDVITGLIKANIPARIAFSVASLMDSRTILDSAGAEKLVGKGDMLFLTPALSTPRRLQGAYVSDEEIKRVVEFLQNAMEEEAEYDDSIVTKQTGGGSSFDFKSGGGGGGGEADDDLFEEAKECVIKAGKASASYLQRRLRVGYARAARLIDLLEEAGIVGASEGAKPRAILVDGSESTMQVAQTPLHSEVIEEEEDEEQITNNQSPIINNEEEEDDDEYEDDEDDEDEQDEDEDDEEDEVEAEEETADDDNDDEDDLFEDDDELEEEDDDADKEETKKKSREHSSLNLRTPGEDDDEIF